MVISYDVAGHGPDVLLLHSGVCDRRMWDPQWPALTQRFRVVRPDLRGFGKTPLGPGRFSHADDVVALLDHLDVEQAIMVGSSFGGLVALETATAHPGRVAGLILLCPAFRGLESTAAADAFDEEEDALLEAGDVQGAVELNIRTWLGPDATAEVADHVRRMQRHAFDVQLAAEDSAVAPGPVRVEVDPAGIDVETVIVTGRRDMDHFQAIAAHLAATMPRAKLVALGWAGHLPSLERLAVQDHPYQRRYVDAWTLLS